MITDQLSSLDIPKIDLTVYHDEHVPQKYVSEKLNLLLENASFSYENIESIGNSCCVKNIRDVDNYDFKIDEIMNNNCLKYDIFLDKLFIEPCDNNIGNKRHKILGKCIAAGTFTAVIGVRDISKNKNFIDKKLIMRIFSMRHQTMRNFISRWKHDKQLYTENIIDIYFYGNVIGAKERTRYVMTKMYRTFNDATLDTMEFNKKIMLVNNLLILCDRIRTSGKYIRDLKLENIGFDENYNIVLIDYEEITIIDPNDSTLLLSQDYNAKLKYWSGTYSPYNIGILEGDDAVISFTDTKEKRDIKNTLLLNSVSIGLVHIIGMMFIEERLRNNFQIFMNKFGYDYVEKSFEGMTSIDYIEMVNREIQSFEFGEKIERLLKILLCQETYNICRTALEFLNQPDLEVITESQKVIADTSLKVSKLAQAQEASDVDQMMRSLSNALERNSVSKITSKLDTDEKIKGGYYENKHKKYLTKSNEILKLLKSNKKVKFVENV